MDTLSPMCSLLVPTLNAVRTKKNLVRNEVHEFQQDLMFRFGGAAHYTWNKGNINITDFQCIL